MNQKAAEFKQEFSNAVKNLNIDFDWQATTDITNIADPIDKVIEKYKNHPSILKINQNVELTQPIKFTKVSEEDILGLIADFDTRKATTSNNIPGKFLKDYAESYSTGSARKKHP